VVAAGCTRPRPHQKLPPGSSLASRSATRFSSCSTTIQQQSLRLRQWSRRFDLSCCGLAGRLSFVIIVGKCNARSALAQKHRSTNRTVKPLPFGNTHSSLLDFWPTSTPGDFLVAVRSHPWHPGRQARLRAAALDRRDLPSETIVIKTMSVMAPRGNNASPTRTT